MKSSRTAAAQIKSEYYLFDFHFLAVNEKFDFGESVIIDLFGNGMM